MLHRLFLSSPDHLERLLRVSTELANGGLPDLAHHLALSSLTPLSKGGNAVRPLALPDGLRRLVASTICEQLRDEFAEVLDPLSVAVGVPAAAEVVAKAVQAHSEHHPGRTYAKNDGRNAYCTMPRGPALDAVDTAFPALGRFCATWYARVSRYVLHRPDGTSRILRSTCGWDQWGSIPSRRLGTTRWGPWRRRCGGSSAADPFSDGVRDIPHKAPGPDS